MTKRALIADPDHEEALRQAAILKDDGFDAAVLTGGDIVAQVEQAAPDVLLLRQERPGGQTGLALIARIKAVAPSTAIVITTSDLTPDAIEKNKSLKFHAEWYLRLPADRAELVAAARSIPEKAPEAEAPLRDPSRPPPLPPSGLRALGQLAKASPRSGDAVLTAEDLTFVEKVFSSIQHIDVDAPINEPPPSAIGDTPDRKLALLRTKLKERERDLAKLSRLWRAREEDLRQQESRVQQKDIELEGMRLRIAELTTDLETANAIMAEREADWGRQIGETYEQHSLNEAELIQAVAAKEAEINKQKIALRKLEDEASAERKDFTTRILEWEKAYADFEQHHWKVVLASVDEVNRLEAQVRSREHDKQRLREAVRDRDNTISVLKDKVAALTTARFEVENEALLTERRAVAAVEGALAQEIRRRAPLEDEIAILREHLFLVEEDLRKHQKLLTWVEGARRDQIATLASLLREGDAERTRLADEAHHFRSHAAALQASLSMVTALGEAMGASLLALDDKKSIILREQTLVRDQAISELSEDKVRLEEQVGDLTNRLGQEEMDHAAESARADEAERDLADTREQLASTETRLQGELDGMTGERDRLTERLSFTENELSTNRADLADEKHGRQQRELEVANLMERKEVELSDRVNRIADLERNLFDAREDLGNVRKTVSTRDERITELLNRVRDADEKQVQLEGQVYRLETANTEKEANLLARDERIAALMEKLTQRDERLEQVEADVKKAQSTILDRQGHIERQDANLEELRRLLATSREETTTTRAELQARGAELFEVERKASTLQAELQNARAEISAGAAVAEQLHAQVTLTDARAAEVRATLEETDAKLRAALIDLDAAGQRADQVKSELAETRSQLEKREAELDEKSRFLADVEKARDQLQATLTATRQMFEQQLAATETDKSELEEQLAQQASENGALSASLSDAARRLEELQQRIRVLENITAEREGRISAQEQILEKASQTTEEQRQLLGERDAELTEVRSALEDARSAIEERARWLSTREASIAELKTALDAERAARGEDSSRGDVLGKELAAARQKSEQLATALAARDKRLIEVTSTSTQALAAEREKVAAAVGEAQRLKQLVGEKDTALQSAGAASAQLAEAQKSEAHVRSEYQKLRAQAEKIVADNRTLKATLEKADADRKATANDADKLRAELGEARAQLTSGSSQIQQVKAEADARAREIADAKALAVRAQQQAQLAMKARAEAEAEAEAVRLRAAREASANVENQQAELGRLNKELLDARKAQRDALAQAQQAKAEAEQIKKMAAQRLAQSRSSTSSPVQGVGAKPPSMPPVAAAAAMPLAPPATRPTTPARSVMSPPQGGTGDGDEELNDFDSPTVVGASGADPYEAQRTVMVAMPDIPSLARGPDKG